MPAPLRVLRVLIYARGTDEEIQHQQRAVQRTAVDLGGHEVVAVATDIPTGSKGWTSANFLLASGEVDVIMVASRRVIPNVIESVTQAIPGRRPRRVRFN
jgi:hypothetical protein